MKRITEFNILPDRRVKERRNKGDYNRRAYFNNRLSRRRTNKFTYPSDKLILEVPLEAQPKSGAVSARIGRGEAFAEFYNKSGISIDLKPLPYKKDDILALGEEWCESLPDKTPMLRSKVEEYADDDIWKCDGIIWQPASTCPSELCRKVKVERVLGVEQMASNVNWKEGSPLTADIKWHSIILVEEIWTIKN